MSVRNDIHNYTPPSSSTRITTPLSSSKTTLDKGTDRLPPIGKEIIQRIENSLEAPITVCGKDGKKLGTVSIRELLVHFATPQHQNDRAISIGSIKIVGSTVPYLLGRSYISDAVKYIGSKSTQSRDLPNPSDIDIRIEVNEQDLSFCYWRVRNYLLHKFGQEPTFGNKKLVHNQDNKFALVTLGDLDLVFYSKLERGSYFSTDDLAIDVTYPLLFPYQLYPPILHGITAPPRQALTDLAQGKIHVDNTKTLDGMAWATLMKHITRGMISPDAIQDELFEKVSKSSTYGENITKRIIDQLETTITKHLGNNPSARIALAFNACVALEGKLHRPKIETIWKALSKHEKGIDSPLLKSLSKSDLPFTSLSAAIKFAACCGGEGIPTRHIEKHNGGKAIQLKEKYYLTFPLPDANTLSRLLSDGKLDKRLLPLFQLFQKSTSQSWLALFLESKMPSALETAYTLVRQGLPCSIQDRAHLFASLPMNTPEEKARLVPLAEALTKQQQPKLGPNAQKCTDRILTMLSQVPAEKAITILHQAWNHRWICNEGKRVASLWFDLCEQTKDPLQGLKWWEEGKESWKKHISEKQASTLLSKHLSQIDLKEIKNKEAILKDLKDTQSMTCRELLFSEFKDKICGSPESQKQALTYLRRLLDGQNISEPRLSEAVFIALEQLLRGKEWALAQALDRLLKGQEWAFAQGLDLLLESYYQRSLMRNDQRFIGLIHKYLRAFLHHFPNLKSKGTSLLEMLLSDKEKISSATARCIAYYLSHELTPDESLKEKVKNRQKDIFTPLTPKESTALLVSFDTHKIPLKVSKNLFSKVCEEPLPTSIMTLMVKAIKREKWQAPNALIEKMQDRLSKLPLAAFKTLLTLLNTHTEIHTKTKGLLLLAERHQKEGEHASAARIYLKLPINTLIPTDLTHLIQTLTQSDKTFRLGLSLLTRYRNRTDDWLTMTQGLKGRSLAIQKTACRVWKGNFQCFMETQKYAECWLTFLDLNLPGLAPHTQFCELENLFIDHLPKEKLVQARSLLYLQTVDHLSKLSPGMVPHIESNLPKLSQDTQQKVQLKLIQFYLKSKKAETFLRGMVQLKKVQSPTQRSLEVFNALKKLTRDTPVDEPDKILTVLRELPQPKLEKGQQKEVLINLTLFLKRFVFNPSLEKFISMLDLIPWLSMNAISKNEIRIALIKHAFSTIKKGSPASAIERVLQFYPNHMGRLPLDEKRRLIKSAVPLLVYAMGNKDFDQIFIKTVADFLRSLGFEDVENGKKSGLFILEKSVYHDFLTAFFSSLFKTYPKRDFFHHPYSEKLYINMRKLLNLTGALNKNRYDLFYQFIFHFWSEERKKFTYHGKKCRELLEEFHAPLITGWKPLKFLQVSLFLEYECSNLEAVQQIMQQTPYREAIGQVLKRLTQRDSLLMRRHAFSILQAVHSLIINDVKFTQICFQMLIRSCAKAPFEVMENMPGATTEKPILEWTLLMFCEGVKSQLILQKGGGKASFEIAKTFFETFKTYYEKHANKKDLPKVLKYMSYLLGKLAGYGAFNRYALQYYLIVKQLEEPAISTIISEKDLRKWSETLFDLLFHKNLHSRMTLKRHSSKVGGYGYFARNRAIKNWMKLVPTTKIKGAGKIAQEELDKCKARRERQNF